MELHGSHLRAKEATKVYLVLIDYCHPPQARHFGIGLECQDRRRKERRLDRAFRSYEKVERGGAGSQLFPVQKKRDLA